MSNFDPQLLSFNRDQNLYELDDTDIDPRQIPDLGGVIEQGGEPISIARTP